jgi:hypothetical protein
MTKWATYSEFTAPANRVLRVISPGSRLHPYEKYIEVEDGAQAIGCTVVDGALVPIPGFYTPPTYAQKRRKEYPSIEDQLDAIFKGGADFDEMKQRIEAIKAKHPKP